MASQLISDIQGVLYNDTESGKQATLGAVDFITHLRRTQVPFMLATNATSEMPSDIVQDLNRLGFGLSIDEVASAVDLSLQYLKDNNIKSVFLITDNDKLRQFYASNGIEVVGYSDTGLCDAVLAGLDQRLYDDTGLTAAVESTAVNALSQGAKLIALHRNMQRKNRSGQIRPNIGKLVEDLENTANYTGTVVIGKPSETFYLEALKKLPSQSVGVTLVAGDDPVGDLSGAHKLGMRTAFVRSGKYNCWPSGLDFKPDYEVGSVAELARYLQKGS